jgi:hypothetical protein
MQNANVRTSRVPWENIAVGDRGKLREMFGQAVSFGIAVGDGVKSSHLIVHSQTSDIILKMNERIDCLESLSTGGVLLWR